MFFFFLSICAVRTCTRGINAELVAMIWKGEQKKRFYLLGNRRVLTVQGERTNCLQHTVQVQLMMLKRGFCFQIQRRGARKMYRLQGCRLHWAVIFIESVSAGAGLNKNNRLPTNNHARDMNLIVWTRFRHKI